MMRMLFREKPARVFADPVSFLRTAGPRAEHLLCLEKRWIRFQ